MTKQSKTSYFNEGNAQRRETHRQKCLKGLEREPNGLTYMQLAAKIGLSFEQTWKRLSDLHADNLVMIAGTTDTYSRYRLVREPGLFKPEKVPTFTQWAKKNRPEIWRDYEVLILHKL